MTLGKRLLATLVVKPANMRRNLDRSGGVVLSEAVMMALARRIGRDRAHALVMKIARATPKDKAPFNDAVRANPEVRKHLTPREIEAALDYSNSLGLSGHFVDQVLKAHEAARRKR
jgi:adenylosuccinate lyase